MTSTPSAGESLPPLSAEDHRCLACDLDFAAVDISDALTAISALPQQVHSTIAAATDPQIRRKPAPARQALHEGRHHLMDIRAGLANVGAD